MEVFNLFAGSIPQEGLSRMERGRKVQSIVPDMRVSIPEEGNLVRRLHGIKLICSSKTRYTIHREGQDATRAVDNRSGELNAEYLSKARTTAELQKRADRADQSVLFFLDGANFWDKHAKNRRKHAKTGEKQAFFWC